MERLHASSMRAGTLSANGQAISRLLSGKSPIHRAGDPRQF
jgi:hypothetical protein